MATVVVHDLEEPLDVLSLARHLLDLLATGRLQEILGEGTLHLTKGLPPVPSDEDLEALVRLDEDYRCLDPSHRVGCTCRVEAAGTDARQLTVVEVPRSEGPVPFVRCSRAGSHARLTDCWQCWCDVQRGALTLREALGR